MNQINANGGYASYLEIYQAEIAPQLEELDIFIKSMDESVSAAEASAELDISPDETYDIMKKLHIKRIDRPAFLQIMLRASSPVCRLYQRELEIGSPYVYTREEIAYIYDLPLDAINTACEDLGIVELTAYSLPELFGHLSMAPADY
jgi:hypothetical protein